MKYSKHLNDKDNIVKYEWNRPAKEHQQGPAWVSNIVHNSYVLIHTGMNKNNYQMAKHGHIAGNVTEQNVR